MTQASSSSEGLLLNLQQSWSWTLFRNRMGVVNIWQLPHGTNESSCNEAANCEWAGERSWLVSADGCNCCLIILPRWGAGHILDSLISSNIDFQTKNDSTKEISTRHVTSKKVFLTECPWAVSIHCILKQWQAQYTKQIIGQQRPYTSHKMI